jgi:ABC-type transporter Mla subunit MlaD
MDELEFARQFVSDAPPTVNDVLARALQADRDELAETRKEREEAAEREARRENMALVNRQFGDPLGHVTRAQHAVAEARAKVRDLEDQLEQARGVLHRAAESYVDWSGQAEQVTATVSRSDTHDLLAPAREALTDAQVRRMAAVRSRAPQRERRPFGGEVSRSHLECVYCLRENVDAETSALLHHDPTWDVPVTSAAQAEQAEQAAAERREHGSYREVVR